MKLKKQLYSIYAKHTKQSLQVIGEWAPTPGGSPAAPFSLNQHDGTLAPSTLGAPPCLAGRSAASLAATRLTPAPSSDIAQGPPGHRITPS